jgi:hypothetical protein
VKDLSAARGRAFKRRGSNGNRRACLQSYDLLGSLTIFLNFT